ncbi:MAG TPA: hypothetical protein V6D11_14865 [Waterburya sp.]|jgi:uncharacterized membrane protein
MNSTVDLIIQILAYITTAICWFWLWWHVTSKIGYRGLTRKFWVAGMCIPPIAPFTLLLLMVLPWPVCKHLRQAQAVQKSESINSELEQLRRQMRR